MCDWFRFYWLNRASMATNNSTAVTLILSCKAECWVDYTGSSVWEYEPLPPVCPAVAIVTTLSIQRVHIPAQSNTSSTLCLPGHLLSSQWRYLHDSNSWWQERMNKYSVFCLWYQIMLKIMRGMSILHCQFFKSTLQITIIKIFLSI